MLGLVKMRYEPWMAQEFSMNVKWGADCIGVKEVNTGPPKINLFWSTRMIFKLPVRHL